MKCTRGVPVCMLLLCLVLGSSSVASNASRKANQDAALTALAAYAPIDTHTHVLRSDPQFTAMLERWHLHVLDILVVDDKNPERGTLDQQRRAALAFIRSSDGHASLCTTFDPFQFSTSTFPQSAITGLNRDFVQGAIAVKIWKNIGMELKDASGHYIMADNGRLEPIYQDIAAHNKTLIAHQAEPDVAWGPSDPKALDASYYAEHPEWKMQDVPGAPAKKTILAARDHLLAMNPKLRVVGAHLGSMESDVDLVAQRLDRYPSFAIDTAARMPHLAIQSPVKVRQFFIKYQDRILYGTDLEFTRQEDAKAAIAEWQEQYALDWRYLATADRFNYQGRTVQGIHLPPSILKKIFHENAVHWIPGIAGPGK